MAYYDNIRLEKGMYAVSGKSFTSVLEELDPSENYKGTALEGLDAFERQLKRFDIKVSGNKSDVVEKFFSTATSAALFPEYVKRAVISGMGDSEILNQIIAAKTEIDSLDYRSITSSRDDEIPSIVAEGSSIPATTIKTQENLVTLNKRGRMLVASYEAIRFQRLDLFTVTLSQIGNRIAKTQLEDAIRVLIDGDGNNNAAEVVELGEGSFAYQDLLNLWSKFEEHEMNTMLVDSTAMLKLLQLEEFKNPTTGLNFQGTGKLSTPMGAALFKTSAVPAGTIVALDNRSALEMVTVGDVNIEYDKLIDRQLERAAITSTFGFAKIFADATKVMNI
jgi:hypothetical protein